MKIATNRRTAARPRLAPIGLASWLLAALTLTGCGSAPEDGTTPVVETPSPSSPAPARSESLAGRSAPEAPAPLGRGVSRPAPFPLDGALSPSRFESSAGMLEPPPLPELPIPPDPSEMASGLRGDVQKAAGEVVGGVGQVFEGLKGDATGAATDLRGGVDGAVGEVRSGFQQTIDEVKGGALDVADELRGEVGSAIGEAKGGVEATIDEAKGGVRQAVDGVKGQVGLAVDEAKDGVRQAIGGVKGKVAGEAQRATEDIKKSARELSGQLFEGLLPPPRAEKPAVPAPAPGPPEG